MLGDRYEEELAKERQAELDFRKTESYRIGKDTESMASKDLISMGFTITDISMEKLVNSEGKEYYSQFDILAVSDTYSFVADIKHSYPIKGEPFVIGGNKLFNYKKQICQTPINDKLLILYTTDRKRLYISVDDIDKCMKHYFDFLIFERDTKSLVNLSRIKEEKILTYKEIEVLKKSRIKARREEFIKTWKS